MSYDRVSEFWWPSDPNTLQVIGGLLAGLIVIGAVVVAVVALISLWHR